MTENQQISSLLIGAEPSARNIFLKAWQRFQKKHLWPLRAKFVRRRYIRRLWILRETAILRYLAENYTSIPKGSPSRAIIWIYRNFAPVRAVVTRVEKMSLRHVIKNN